VNSVQALIVVWEPLIWMQNSLSCREKPNSISSAHAVHALEVQKQLSKSSLNFKSVDVKACYAAHSESCGTFDSM